MPKLHTLLPAAFARDLVTRKIPAQLPPPQGIKQILVDVSVIVHSDAGTGIQRVVRGLWLQFIKNPPTGYQVRAIFASRNHGYTYIANFSDQFPCLPQERKEREQVRVNAGDIFLGLDLAAHILPLHAAELTRWKRRGARLYFLIYDLLPELRPDWFQKKTVKAFQRWLRTLAIHADGLICISKSVKDDVALYLKEKYSIPEEAIRLHFVHPGADLQSTNPSIGRPPKFDEIFDQITKRPTVLMVGTLEPRKGYAQALGAFEILWEQEKNVNLVIAGRPGWKVDKLIGRLSSHPELNNRLYWFSQASDEMLRSLYKGAHGLLMASEGEGYGLPLVEAASHGLPVLVRDLPVFREIGCDIFTYFSGSSSEELADILQIWLMSLDMNPGIKETKEWLVNLTTWEKSANKIFRYLLQDEIQTELTNDFNALTSSQFNTLL